MKVVFAADVGELQRALNHAQRGIAEAVHDAVGERAVIRADADGALEPLAFQHERRELFLDTLQFLGVLRVGVFLDGKFLGVGIVAGIDTNDFHPFHRFHRGFGLEMDVGDNRHKTLLFVQFGDDVLQVRRVLHRRRGDAHDLATDGDEVERLLHAGGGVHRVAGDHGLDDDRMATAGNNAAMRGVADDNLATLTALKEIRRLAVTHKNYFGAAKTTGTSRSACALRSQSPVSKNAM